MRRTVGLVVGCLALFLGCSTTGNRIFTVESFPPGADVFVDQEKVAVTPAQNLSIFFKNGRPVTVRIEKDGFQPTGTVVEWQSALKLSFFLQEAPNNTKILEVLNSIDGLLGGIQNDLNKLERK